MVHVPATCAGRSAAPFPPPGGRREAGRHVIADSVHEHRADPGGVRQKITVADHQVGDLAGLDAAQDLIDAGEFRRRESSRFERRAGREPGGDGLADVGQEIRRPGTAGASANLMPALFSAAALPPAASVPRSQWRRCR